MQYSSNPNSELNQARRDYMLSKKLIGFANKGMLSKRIAFRQRNTSLKRLRDICREMRGLSPVQRYTPDVLTTVCGIPCGVVAVNYEPGTPMIITGFGFGDAIAPDPGEREWFLVDRRGYKAEWLESKMTHDDEKAVDDLVDKYYEEMRKC